MLEDSTGPAFVLPETTDKRVGLTTAEVAERLRETDGEQTRLVAQVRGLVRRFHLEPVAIYTGDARGAYLFDDAALLTAAALGWLLDHRLSDRFAMAAAALALNRFRDEDWPTGRPILHSVPREARSSAEWLVDQWRIGGGGWFLDLGTFRNPRWDNPITKARLRHITGPDKDESYGTRFRPGEGYELRVVTTLALDGPLSKLFGVPRTGGATH